MGLMAMVEKRENHPEWVRNAWSMQFVQPAAEGLSIYLKQRVGSISLSKPERS
jgi:hypothetical protein